MTYIPISQGDYERALERGRQALAKPHAQSARYISDSHVLELIYSGGLSFRIDLKNVSVLKGIPPTALEQARVTPGGDGLIFGDNDVLEAISIPGLLEGLVLVDANRHTVAE